MADANNDKVTRLAQGLEGVLADSYVLYNALQVSHWNVVGPHFHSLHQLFEEQYTELAGAIDEIAERIRTLGFFTRGTLNELVSMSRIEQVGDLRSDTEMLEHLIGAQQQLVHRIREVQGLAEEAVDEASLDLMVERQAVHEKATWMLKSQAGESFETLAEMPKAKAEAA